ncbi:hypothetical protein [Actinomadura latina]|uniref:DUF393 domain-containing protein n=1 Tax=Actinomadura latina TaxID=163603 RepID=A0A846YQH4_9ACTN|nr:hypothetical protein [Actinomadura latina]NKZ02391.1 hypothetical protein [Actinomadura latina]
MTEVVVVYDGACGGCSSIAARLSRVLAPPVLVRSCRDPSLPADFPVLGGSLRGRPCRRPTLITVFSDGRMEASGGPAMLWRGARMVAPGRRADAVRLALRVAWWWVRHS